MGKDLRSKKINQIMYISIGCVIALIILIVTLFMALNKNKNNQKISLEVGDSQNNNSSESEEASSSIGNKIEETDEYQEVGKVNSDNQKNTNDVNPSGQSDGNAGTANGTSNMSANSSNEVNTDTNNENEISNANVSTNSNTNSSSTEGSTSTSKEPNTNVTDSNQNTNDNNSNSTTQVGHDNQVDAQVAEETPKDPTFAMPVDGEIMKEYGKDKLLYSDTLKEWTTHLGIDIKADKTSIVKSSSDGTVKSIKNDPRYGLTIVIEHENGFSSVYSNLLTAEFVVVDEKVKSGQTIGTVGNSATFEILDDAHLHFEILKDGKTVDPQMYIK